MTMGDVPSQGIASVLTPNPVSYTHLDVYKRQSFHDLRFCHYVGMTLSLSGLYFYGHDLGGFSGCLLYTSRCV